MLLSTLTDGVLRNVYVQKQNEILGGVCFFLRKKLCNPKLMLRIALVWSEIGSAIFFHALDSSYMFQLWLLSLLILVMSDIKA